MKTRKTVLLLTGLIMIVTTCVASAATKGRILTNGKVTMHKNGQAVRTITGQGPIDENALIACEGTCMVKMKGLSLIGTDDTMFAVKEMNNEINLYVVRGTINFAVSDVSKQFSFYIPTDNIVKTEGFLAPASTGSSVKGYINVNDKSAEIGMDSGTMLVQTNEGSQSIAPGQSIQLAMVDVPDGEKDEGNDPGGGLILEWSSLSTWTQVGIVAAGVGVTAGIAALTFQNTTGDTPRPGVGPGPPPTTPPPVNPPGPPPASRNQ